MFSRGGTLGLAGVGAALVLALSADGAAAPPAFAVTHQEDGSVLVTVDVDVREPWVLGADRKLAAMGFDEQIAVDLPQPGPATASGPVNCTAGGGGRFGRDRPVFGERDRRRL